MLFSMVQHLGRRRTPFCEVRMLLFCRVSVSGLPMYVLEAWAYGLPVVMTLECNLQEGFASHAALEIRSGEGNFPGKDFNFQCGLRTLLEMSDRERAAMGLRGRRFEVDPENRTSG